MKYFVRTFFLALLSAMMLGCTHCDFGPFSRGQACLPCDFELIQSGETPDLSARPTFRLRIHVVDDVGTPISSGGLCPGFYYGGTRLGADAFQEVSRGVFEGRFPGLRKCWAVLNIRTKDPKPFGRGMYRFALIKDTDVYFVLHDWTRKSRSWGFRNPADCIICIGDSSLDASIPRSSAITVDQEGRSKPILVPRDLDVRVQYNDGSPYWTPGLCAEVFFNDVVQPVAAWNLSEKGKNSRIFYSPKFVESPEQFHWTVQIRLNEEGLDHRFSQEVLGGVPRGSIVFKLPFSPPVIIPEGEAVEDDGVPLGVATVEDVVEDDVAVETVVE